MLLQLLAWVMHASGFVRREEFLELDVTTRFSMCVGRPCAMTQSGRYVLKEGGGLDVMGQLVDRP